MRPLCLEMNAIGPFLQKTIINFDQIDNNALFLIHGNTGIGKSFIFDAMCYTLFGETPSNRGPNLKSDHASVGIEPSIIFSFSVGKNIFQVKRILSYERKPKKKRISKTVKEPESGLLLRMSAWPNGDKKTIATKKTDINSHLKKIIGLDANQFSQVILLPQGEFRKLLLSESIDRENLLSRLFNSDIYDEIQNLLNENRKKTEKVCHDAAEKTKILLQQSKSSIPEKLLETIKNPDRKTLNDATKLLKQNLPELETDIKKSSQELRYYSEKLEKEKICANIFNEKEKIKLQINDLNNEYEQIIVPFINKIELDNKASKIMPEIKGNEKLLHELCNSKKDLEKLKCKLNNALKDLEISEKNTSQINELQNQQNELKSRIERLKPLIDLSAEMDKLTENLDKKKDDVIKWQKKTDSAEKKNKCHNKTLYNFETKLKKIKCESENFAELAISFEEAKKYKLLLKELNIKEDKLDKLESSVNKAEKIEEKCSQNVISLKNQREKGLAGELAQILKEKMPCPVCGSTKHPCPAPPPDKNTSFKAIEKAEKKLITSQKNLQENNLTKNNFFTEKKRINNDITMVGIKHNSWENKNPETFMPIIEEIEKKYDLQEKNRKKIKSFENEIENLKENLIPVDEKMFDKNRQQLSTFIMEENELRIKLDEKNKIWDLTISKEKEIKLSEKNRCRQLKKLIENLEEESLKIPATIKKFEKEKKNAQIKASEIAGSLKEKEKQQKEINKSYIASYKNIKILIDKSSFKNIKEITNASMDVNKREISLKQIEDHKKKVEGKKTLLEKTTNDLKGKKYPDLDELKEKRDNKEKINQENIRKSQDIKNHLTILDDISKEISSIDKSSIESAKQLEILGKIDDQVRGQGNPKISLKRFFLAQRLEEVLIQASQRLTLLSRGRFTLKRDENIRHRAVQTGLDLNIFDHHTGTERPASTLSGGQMFLASLSLALGLADVVQARSGGINIEALFIDEGFGSLDEETLQLALQVLNELRKGRMVGVISHVTELNRQISNCIEVKKVSIGSGIKLVMDK